MKRYFVKYYADFANTYTLAYTIDKKQAAKAIAEGYEQVTRSHAEALCKAEKDREKYDAAFSGRASSVIVPFDFDADLENPDDDRMFRRSGYILERI